MTERRSLFMLVVLVLAMVIPTSGSADRGPAKETPTPIVATATPTPISDEAPDGILDRLGYDNAPDPQAMDQFRHEFLDLVDGLDALVANVPLRPGHLSNAHSSLEKARKGIRELTDEQLYMLQSSLEASGVDFQAAKAGVEYTKSRVLTPGKETVEKDQLPTIPSPTPEGTGERGQGSGPSLSSFTIIPTPTPVSTPIAPAITHQDQEQTNDEAGDLFNPNWPTDIGCPEEGYPTEVMFGLMIGLDALKAGSIILEALCTENTIIVGLNVQDPIQCLIKSILDYIILAAQTVNDGFDLCNGLVDSATIQALYEDTKIVHADLAEHDANLHTRFNTTDKFLFNFRNLSLRLNIEANLASPDDDPHALLALPRSVCISAELETLQQTDPFAPEVIAGCGQLELVRDTVQSAIDMNKIAGQGVHNAEAEFQAAVNHYNNGEWKLAYARFRKAYREAVRP